MHEHALIHNVIETILKELGPKPGRVSEVALKVGALELHGQESFRQMFAVESQGTPLEGAALELTVIPAVIKCACGHEGPSGEGVDHHSDMPVAECPACGQICRVQGGRGVLGIDLKVCD
ncbi:MAG: hydrogenase maturation nickel metallochaperone HypA [Elusimicrobiota bacterium]|jgi:hydrogenase nickel insertion protein HypA